jgi:hypothetical protein
MGLMALSDVAAEFQVENCRSAAQEVGHFRYDLRDYSPAIVGRAGSPAEDYQAEVNPVEQLEMVNRGLGSISSPERLKEWNSLKSSEGRLLARSGQGPNFRFGQEHRTFLSVNEFHYLTRSGHF